MFKNKHLAGNKMFFVSNLMWSNCLEYPDMIFLKIMNVYDAVYHSASRTCTRQHHKHRLYSHNYAFVLKQKIASQTKISTSSEGMRCKPKITQHQSTWPVKINKQKHDISPATCDCKYNSLKFLQYHNCKLTFIYNKPWQSDASTGIQYELDKVNGITE